MSALDILNYLIMYGGHSVIPASQYVFAGIFSIRMMLGIIAYGAIFAGLYIFWREGSGGFRRRNRGSHRQVVGEG